MLLPDKIVNSLPDWPYDARTTPHLRQYFLGLCDVASVESGALGELINGHFFKQLRNGFWGGEAHPVRRTTSLLERKKKSGRRPLQVHGYGPN